MPHDKDLHKYDAIINLPHPTSKRHPRMSMLNRAAQFSPFAALTGYDAAVKETARLTEKWIELDEGAKEELNAALRLLIDHLPNAPEAAFTYFEPDDKKEGGAYITAIGQLKKVNEFERWIQLHDGRKVPIEAIIKIETVSQ